MRVGEGLLAGTCTMVTEPISDAAINADEPSSCIAFGSAPFLSSSATTGPLFEPAARESAVKPAIEKTVPLTDDGVREAFRLLHGRRVVGKLAIEL